VTRWHRAWLVAAVTFLVLLTSAAFRSSVGVLVVPFENEFGWSRSATSIAVAVNLVLYGVTAPFATALMERFGVKNIAAGALALIAIGTGLTTVMTDPWHLVILWGVIVGLGVGATALVFGSLVVNRWFVERRGLMLGVMGAAWATGQLVFLPLIANTIDAAGWRTASWGIAIAALVLVPIIWFVIADRPSDVGLLPYGADPHDPPEEETNTKGSAAKAAGSAITTLVEIARHRTFWILAGTFFICGWTTNGIISTHFIPAAHDEGMHATTAAGLLAVVGIFDLIGTIGSGWLTDRFDPRKLLAIYYGVRGIALLAMPAIIGPAVEPPILVIMVLFGLDWVATVPPTAILCTRAFGPEKGAVVFGWVFASHMIGAAAAALLSGAIRDITGDYLIAWLLAGVLAIGASVAAMALPHRLRRAEPTRAT
jgi:MFS family permease